MHKRIVSEENFRDLEEKGYTVVPGVIPLADCANYIGHYDRWLDAFQNNFHKWPKSTRGLIRGYNAGHLDPTWRVRLQAKRVFSEIWKTDKLLTSFDAISVGRPPEEGEEPFDDGSSNWLHLDQHAIKVGLHAYQGGVNLEEALEDDWTLQVIENSHKFFENFFEDHETLDRNKQFLRINDMHIKYYEQKGCVVKRVPVPKGGIVLWDSRVVHANVPPKKGRANPGRWRRVVFVSMTPAIWASDADLEVKLDAYKNAKMTDHWSSDGAKLMQDFSDSKIHPKKLPGVAKTLEAQRLSGVVPYKFNDGKPNGPPKPVTRR